MLKYSRIKTCGVQQQGRDHRVVSGVLEDELYAMNCEIRVNWHSMTIDSVKTCMKRFTTDRCLLAENVFRNCEGWSIDSDLDSRIKKELGRNGCRHMAVLMVDCLNALVRAELARELAEALSKDSSLDRKSFVEEFLSDNPSLAGYLKVR